MKDHFFHHLENITFVGVLIKNGTQNATIIIIEQTHTYNPHAHIIYS